MGNNISSTFNKIKTQFDNTQTKLSKGLIPFDAQLDDIIKSQKKFTVSSEDFIQALLDVVKMLIAMVDVLVDSADVFIILIPAGMILYIVTKLTTII